MGGEVASQPSGSVLMVCSTSMSLLNPCVSYSLHAMLFCVSNKRESLVGSMGLAT